MKKPSLDFSLRLSLDGSEEVYTQSPNYNPPEQKFTVASIFNYVLEGIAGNVELTDLNGIPNPPVDTVVLIWKEDHYEWEALPTASNGVVLENSSYKLGGDLLENTQIETGDFELALGNEKTQVQLSQSNPYFPSGRQSAFLQADNTNRGTESFIGVTDHLVGTFAHIWSRKASDDSYAFLQQNWSGAVLKAEDGTTGNLASLQISTTQLSMSLFEGGSTTDGGTISNGIDVSEIKRIKNDQSIALRIAQSNSTSNELEIRLQGLPTYADQAAAQADNYPIEGIYKTATGELRIVI